MPLTAQHVADEFFAASEAAGLKRVTVQVGMVDEDTFLVTVTLPNPVASGIDDEFLVSSHHYEFDDADHLKRLAAHRAAVFARAIPTIH